MIVLLGRPCWAAAQHRTDATRATTRRAGRVGVKLLPRGTVKAGQHVRSAPHNGGGGQAPALPRRGVRGNAATGVRDEGALRGEGYLSRDGHLLRGHRWAEQAED